jgi:hypothetical protein
MKQSEKFAMLSILLMFLAICDTSTTLYLHSSSSGFEMNMMLAKLIDVSKSAFAFSKLIVVALAIGLLYVFYNSRKSINDKSNIRTAMVILCVIYAIVVANNIRYILLM